MSLSPVTFLTHVEIMPYRLRLKMITPIRHFELKGKDGKTVEAKDADHGVDPVQTYSSDAPVSQDSVLTDADLAAQYRSQADALFKEAQSLRKQAEELVPTKKKTKSDAKETA